MHECKALLSLHYPVGPQRGHLKVVPKAYGNFDDTAAVVKSLEERYMTVFYEIYLIDPNLVLKRFF